MRKTKLPDVLYADRELVELYDTLNSERDDIDFYLNSPLTPPARILDAGCGTGALAIDLAKQGHQVIAIDPAPEMIALAEEKPGAERVDWQVYEIGSFQSEAAFDLVVMSGHAFQCLLNDEDILACFQTVRRVLKDSGSFMFETRNPHTRAWENWTTDNEHEPKLLPYGHVVYDLLSEDGELVTFQETYSLGADRRRMKISQSTLRFADSDTILRLAALAGLRETAILGDWDGSPFDQGSSPEIIFRLEPA